MRIIPIVEVWAGTTLRATWCNTGVTPSSIYSSILDSSNSLVSSMTAISSGNGFYYGLHTLPNTQAWYVNEWRAVIDSYSYVNRQLVLGKALTAGP